MEEFGERAFCLVNDILFAGQLDSLTIQNSS